MNTKIYSFILRKAIQYKIKMICNGGVVLVYDNHGNTAWYLLDDVVWC